MTFPCQRGHGPIVLSSPPARECCPSASRLSPLLRLDLVPNSRAQMFLLESHFTTQFSSLLPPLRATRKMSGACRTRLRGGVTPRGAGLRSLAAPRPVKFLTQLPVTSSLQGFTADTQTCGDVRTPAGRRQPHGGHLCVQEDGATVTAALLRVQPPWQRVTDTHTLVSEPRAAASSSAPRR